MGIDLFLLLFSQKFSNILLTVDKQYNAHKLKQSINDHLLNVET